MIGEAAAIRLEIQHLSSDKVCDIGNIEIRLDEEFVPFGNREDNTQEEGFGGADKDSAEEMEEDDLDLSDEGNECSSDGVSSWGILPDVCLRQAFAFLSDSDRLSAGLVCRHWHHSMCAPSLWRSRFFYFTGTAVHIPEV